MGVPLRQIVMAGSVAALAACASRPPSPPPATDPATACLAGLNQRAIQYRRLSDWTTPEGCNVVWAVEVERTSVAWNRPATVTCPMAATIWDFETTVMQPAARRLLGRSVVRLVHYGAYTCRAVRGNGGSVRMSQHSLGQAIDVAGFDLDDGTRVSVLRDWGDPGAKGAFLHQVAQSACGVFSVVLGPNYDQLHRNHLHFDIGPYKLCRG